MFSPGPVPYHTLASATLARFAGQTCFCGPFLASTLPWHLVLLRIRWHSGQL